MSLNQKYTWKDFLKDNPEHKKEDLKRTSKEGKKAFEAAFKVKVKEYLQDYQKKIEKQKGKIEQTRMTVIAKVQAFQKKKDWSKANFYQKKVGNHDSALASLTTQILRAKEKLKKL
ncbi:MAG: hypothetical protein ABIE74_13110 [Pseudomonadota bacterium]